MSAIGHAGIIGPTMCGKTTLAAELARGWRARGVNVLVCDPLLNDWPATWQTSDREQFVGVAKRSQRCALFVDEAGQTISRDPEAEWLFTTARHWGHCTHVLSQGGTQLTPTMRGQLSRLFLFGCSQRVAEMWAEEFNDLNLLGAVHLPRFAFMYKVRFEPVRTMKLARDPAPAA